MKSWIWHNSKMFCDNCEQFWIAIEMERICTLPFSIFIYTPKFWILLSSFSFFFIDLTDWKTIFVKIIQFYSTVHCSVTTKAKVIASFLKALEKSIFHPCEPNMAGFVKYGPDLYFVFNFHVLFLVQIYFKTLFLLF